MGAARIAGITLFAVALADAALAQPQAAAKLPRVVLVASECKSSERDEALYEGLRRLKRIPDRTIALERKCYHGANEFRQTIRGAVESGPEVLVVGSPAAAIAARMVSGKVPIVCASCGDPLDNGLVASLARPGGNVTGLASLSAELIGKRLELVRELSAQADRVAALVNPDNPGTRPTLAAFDEASRNLRIEIVRFEFRSAADFDKAFASAARANVRVVLLQDDPFMFAGRAQVAELGIKHGLLTIGGLPDLAEAGGLIAYGPDRKDLYRRAASFVDKILNGANPADLPIEQPSKFELVVNLKTARALKVEIPKPIVLRADRVIE